jgi:hypothetical protein
VCSSVYNGHVSQRSEHNEQGVKYPEPSSGNMVHVALAPDVMSKLIEYAKQHDNCSISNAAAELIKLSLNRPTAALFLPTDAPGAVPNRHSVTGTDTGHSAPSA